MAVLDHTEIIDAFTGLPGNREKWVRHIATSKYPLGPIKDVLFSFTHPLINAHFRFALYILEVLGVNNTIFQAKYGFSQDCGITSPLLTCF